MIPQEFELDPQKPLVIRRKQEYDLRDHISAIEAQVKALKAEELQKVAELEEMRASIDTAAARLERHRLNQQEADRVFTLLSNQLLELLGPAGDDARPEPLKRPSPNNEDDNERRVTRRKGKGRAIRAEASGVRRIFKEVYIFKDRQS